MSINRILLKRLAIEGKSQINNIEKILLFRKPKYLIFNETIYRNKNKKTENEIFNEAFKNIYLFNKSLINNIKTYREKRKENNNFIKGYKIYKKEGKKIIFKDIERKIYMFGHLLKLYEKKGYKIPSQIFQNDIYKGNSLLACNKNRISNYFEQEVNSIKERNKKGEKSLKFMKKLLDELIFKKKDFENKDFASISYEDKNNDNIIYHRERINKDNVFKFFDKIQLNLNEIDKQKKEISKIKELISNEEIEYKLIHTKKKQSKSFIESYKSIPKHQNKIKQNKIFIYESDNKANKMEKNSLNNGKDNIYKSYQRKKDQFSKTAYLMKSNSFFKNRKKLEKGFIISSLNNLHKLYKNKREKIKTKLILNNFKNNKYNCYFSNRSMEPKSEISISHKGIKRINIKSLNKPKLASPLFINKLMHKKKFFFPNTNLSNINTIKNKSINETDNSNMNKRINSISSLRKNNSQPTFLNTTIKDMYERISKFNFYPHKIDKNDIIAYNLYKTFYGNKIKKYNNKELLLNYYNIKGNVINYEHNDKIFSKYRELLCNKTVNNIKTIKEQNKKLKDNPANYIKVLYDYNAKG